MRTLFFLAVMTLCLFFGLRSGDVPAQNPDINSLSRERRERIIDTQAEIRKNAYSIGEHIEARQFDEMNAEFELLLDRLEALPVEDRVFFLKDMVDIFAHFAATPSDAFERLALLFPPAGRKGDEIDALRGTLAFVHARAICLTQGDADAATELLDDALDSPLDKAGAAIMLWDTFDKSCKDKRKLTKVLKLLPEPTDFNSLLEPLLAKALEYYGQAYHADDSQKPDENQKLQALYIMFLDMLYRGGQYDKAVDFAEKYMPEDRVEAISLLMVYCLKMERNDKALTYAEKFLSTDPEKKDDFFLIAHSTVLAHRHENDFEQWSMAIGDLVDEYLANSESNDAASEDSQTSLRKALWNSVYPMIRLQPLKEIWPVIMSLADDLRLTSQEKGMLAVQLLTDCRDRKHMGIDEMKALAESCRGDLENLEPKNDPTLFIAMYLAYAPEDVIDGHVDAFLAEGYDSARQRLDIMRYIAAIGRAEKIKSFVFGLDDDHADKWELLPLVVTSHFHPRVPDLESEGPPHFHVADEAAIRASVAECMELIGTIKDQQERAGKLVAFIVAVAAENVPDDGESLEPFLQNAETARQAVVDNLTNAEDWQPEVKAEILQLLFELKQHLEGL